eukprot:m.105523 g.105523  ORF g.105523 m.105523 type:complete len:596 (-) comp13880_c1_seq2:421-2208(-)
MAQQNMDQAPRLNPQVQPFQSSSQVSPAQSPERIQKLGPEELRESIKHQLNYYFSEQNLFKDLFLVSQMNPEMYVKCELVAGFRQIQSRTTDLNLVVELLRESENAEVDAEGLMVRPKNHVYLSQPQFTLVLNNIPADTEISQIEALFSGIGTPKICSDFMGRFFVSFDNQEAIQKAYGAVQTLTFNDQLINFTMKPEPLLPGRQPNNTPQVAPQMPAPGYMPYQQYNTPYYPPAMPYGMYPQVYIMPNGMPMHPGVQYGGPPGRGGFGGRGRGRGGHMPGRRGGNTQQQYHRRTNSEGSEGSTHSSGSVGSGREGRRGRGSGRGEGQSRQPKKPSKGSQDRFKNKKPAGSQPRQAAPELAPENFPALGGLAGGDNQESATASGGGLQMADIVKGKAPWVRENAQADASGGDKPGNEMPQEASSETTSPAHPTSSESTPSTTETKTPDQAPQQPSNQKKGNIKTGNQNTEKSEAPKKSQNVEEKPQAKPSRPQSSVKSTAAGKSKSSENSGDGGQHQRRQPSKHNNNQNGGNRRNRNSNANSGANKSGASSNERPKQQSQSSTATTKNAGGVWGSNTSQAADGSKPSFADMLKRQ